MITRKRRILLSTISASLLMVGCANQTYLEKSEQRLIDEAESGKADAAHALCYRYTHGIELEQNDDKAFEWCTRAGATQNPKSSTLLADLYYQGKGTPQDYRKAAKLYYYAAERGVEKAMFMMYQIYTHGHGVEVDLTEARYYLNRAAARKYPAAMAEKQKVDLEN